MSNLYEILQGKKLQRKVRAIVTNQAGKFLLIQPHSYENHMWTFVGGGVESEENLEQAMKRELKEEVGIETVLSITASSIKPWYEFSPKFKKSKANGYDGQIANLFWIEVPNDISIKLQDEEVRDFRWASLNEVRELVTVPEQIKWFNAVVEELSKDNAA